MNALYDLSLPVPFSNVWVQVLLFTTFSMHLLFVLMLVGTALLGIFYFIQRERPEAGEIHRNKGLFHSFLGLKTLAVVLGVGPLLLIQVNYTLPFFNATSLFAPYWLLIIVILVFSFVLFDSLGHADAGRTWIRRLAILALLALLIVPAIFVLILSVAESPDRWPAIIENDFFPDQSLAIHWLFRYLHILGAAVVFGAVFHYFFNRTKDGRKNQAMLRWLFIGLLAQFVIGPMLVVTLLKKISFYPGLFLFTGIAASAMLAWIVSKSMQAGVFANIKSPVAVLLVLFLSMLLVRQLLQREGFLPLVTTGKENLAVLERKLDPYRKLAMEGFQRRLKAVYDNGEKMYTGSCSFCHGADGSGKGAEARNLAIPPADLTAVRADSRYLREGILHGVPGTGMPYFALFDKNKIDSLLEYLETSFHSIGKPDQVPFKLSDNVMRQAGQVYESVCTPCHGADGKGRTAAGQNLSPKPPDFTAYSLTPQKTFEIISRGYPGTAMPPFADLAEKVRWGLVEIVNSKRQ